MVGTSGTSDTILFSGNHAYTRKISRGSVYCENNFVKVKEATLVTAYSLGKGKSTFDKSKHKLLSFNEVSRPRVSKSYLNVT